MKFVNLARLANLEFSMDTTRAETDFAIQPSAGKTLIFPQGDSKKLYVFNQKRKK